MNYTLTWVECLINNRDIINKELDVGDNKWNTIMEIEFDKEVAAEIKKYLQDTYKNNNDVYFSEKSRLYLLDFYFNKNYGLKMIARGVGVSYTVIRRLFKRLNIEHRKGYNVITDRVKQFRSERVSGNKNPWFDWCTTHPDMKDKNKMSISGYYKTNNNKFVYLRSTWEYIYAKWLDCNNINWSFETISYKLSNGEYYRPDFFIMDDNNNLKYIVEIKGFYKNRMYKIELFKQNFPEIHIIIIDNISDYTNNYLMEIKKWKRVRLLEKK